MFKYVSPVLSLHIFYKHHITFGFLWGCLRQWFSLGQGINTVLLLCFTGVEGNCVKLKNILVAWPRAPMSSTWKKSHEHRKFPFYLRVTKDRKEQHKAPCRIRWSKNDFTELCEGCCCEMYDSSLLPTLYGWLAHANNCSSFYSLWDVF